MPLNLQSIIIAINSSLIIILFSSIFFFQLTSSTSFFTKAPNSTALGININNTFSSVEKNNTFFITLLKTLTTLSFFPLILSIVLNFPDIVVVLNNWFSLNSFSFNLELHYDFKFNLFFFVALAVSSSIIEFSHYYMNSDPNKNAFFHLLIIFLLNMVILTFSNNLFFLFIGWEGVGFLSFMLISWWQTRTSASNAALQAIIYNRIGDIGLLLFFALTLVSFNSWSISEISSININTPIEIKLLLIGALIAATGKSAQFGLHPWLPAAMEGPTPVSALLHSSTMVVAGIFLLIRISPIYSSFISFNNWCLILGAITAIFAATTAISQHDIKKIIAYSTTSQLGLMMVAIGLNAPTIALFHICTHAFFKAMLFLSSGSIIHSLNDEQDLRKMGGLYLILPNTSACIILGSLALAGTPFLAGFYSKDLILEISLTSLSNFFSIIISFIATLLTAAYSMRIILFCFTSSALFNPLSPTSEEDKNLVNALNRLALGTILSGWTISTFILFNTPITLQLILKSLALIVTLAATFYSALIVKNLMTLAIHSPLASLLNSFTTLQWFYQNAAHSLISSLSFLTSLTLSTRNIDQGWNENIGAQGIASSSSNFSKTYQLTQTGYIKHYLLMSSLIMITIVIVSYIYIL
uniref:NADH-ubiquinone oxidoreductase chain 5 n=1 Tax=Aphelasterias japonica TaxID=194597 RepID=A0A0A0V9D2_9ECHI|nr:NADH dehydrogenase subunit 5 [Aphelasterias japonica]AIW65064.1 NADH dehydrogenase subunit 5 [Aphelasterias japonica]